LLTTGNHRRMSHSVTLRAITPDDEDFLYRVYASTREEELARTGWDEEQTVAFLQMQFRAQQQDYRQRFSSAEFQVILLNERPVGRLYVDRRQDEIRIIDIALLTPFRNAGIGSKLMERLVGEADQADLPIRIHVEQGSPALRIYDRFGFLAVSQDEIYILMERPPGAATKPAANQS
jgi:ribosomal protein S18 acetylase RimI-like enzyme